MKNCPYCNTEILDEAVFCVHCSTALGGDSVKSAPNANVCPQCGNECDKNAVICVKCGYSFKSQGKTGDKKTVSKNKLISIIAIALCALGTIINVVNLFQQSFKFSSFFAVVASVIVLAGLILGKKNKLPVIGYAVSVLVNVVTMFMNDNITLINIASVIPFLPLLLLYTGKKPYEKYWLAPVIMSGAIAVIGIIMNLLDSVYTYDGYYSDWFMWDLFLIDVGTKIGLVLGFMLESYNAKLNWFDD